MDEGSKKFDEGLLYQYLGRATAHTAPIVGISFGMKDIYETLVSVSEDRWVCCSLPSPSSSPPLPPLPSPLD